MLFTRSPHAAEVCLPEPCMILLIISNHTKIHAHFIHYINTLSLPVCVYCKNIHLLESTFNTIQLNIQAEEDH